MRSIARAKRSAVALAVTGAIAALIVVFMSAVGRPTVAEETAAPIIISGYGPAIPLRGFEWHRPADFFREQINRDPAVCDPLLRSLNEPYDPQPDDRPSIILLYNEYLVPWRDKRYLQEYKQYDKTIVEVWRQIVGDLDGDMNTDAVYLTWVSENRNLHFDYLYFSPAPQSDEISNEILSTDRYRELRGIVEPYPTFGGVSATSNELFVRHDRMKPYIPNLRGIGSFQDIVRLLGREYLLNGALPAIHDPDDPEQVDPQYLATVTLFAVLPGGYFEPKCQFVANTFLVRMKGRKP